MAYRDVGRSKAIRPPFQAAVRNAGMSASKRKMDGGLNGKHPDRDDGAENGKARNGPSRRISSVVHGPVHHGIPPTGHESLL